MAQATIRDTRAGFEILNRSGFRASREEINKRLKQMRYRPISARTYRHYLALANEGFNRYISINRFDVARATEPYEDLGSRGRYRYASSSVGARVTFPRGRRLVEAFGRAEQVGESGLVLVFDTSPTVEALNKEGSRPRLGEFVRVELLDPVAQFDARIVELERTPEHVTIEVEFTRLQSVAEYIGREPLPVRHYRVRLVAADQVEPTVDVVGRHVYYLFEFLELARAVVNEAALGAKGDRYAPVTQIHRMNMRSPLDILMSVSDSVAIVLGLAFGPLGVAITFEK